MEAKNARAGVGAVAWAPIARAPALTSDPTGGAGSSGSDAGGGTGSAAAGAAGSAAAGAEGVDADWALPAMCARYSTAFVAILDRRAHAPQDRLHTARRGSRSSRSSVTEARVARGCLQNVAFRK